MEYLNGQQEKEAAQWMTKSAEIAAKALCHRAKCGTVIVKNGEIIGEGYNAPPLDKEEYRTCNKEFGPGKRKIEKFVLWHEEGICEYQTDEYNRLSYEYIPTK